MNNEVLRESLFERRRSVIWWSVGIVAMIALNLAFYPSLQDSAGLADYAKDLPESLRALFAGGELDLVSGAGYLNSQIFALMIPIMLLIFAIGAGASAVAGDEERGTLDLLMAQPVSRASYVLQRYLALLALLAVLTLAVLVTVALGSALVNLEIGFDKLVAASGGIFFLAALFGALGLAVGSLWPGRARAIGIAAALAIAAWVLDGLGQAVASLEAWRPLSPFYQAVGKSPLREGVPLEAWGLLAAGAAVFVAIAIVGLKRRDIQQ